MLGFIQVSRRFCLGLGLLSLMSIVQPPIFADAPDDTDLQAWFVTSASHEFHNGTTATVELQPRWNNNITQADRILLSGSLSFPVTKTLSVAQGYTWRGLFQPVFTNENRPWQQLQWKWTHGRLTFSERVRLEERFLENSGGITLRGRAMSRLAIALDRRKRWAWVLSDELYHNLASNADPPKNGFEQNRLFTGFNRKLTHDLTVEAGYLMQYFPHHHTQRSKLNHAIFLTLAFIL